MYTNRTPGGCQVNFFANTFLDWKGIKMSRMRPSPEMEKPVRYRVLVSATTAKRGRMLPGASRSWRAARLVAEGFNREMRAGNGRYRASVARIKNPPRA